MNQRSPYISTVLDILLITLGTLIVALSVYFFMIPSQTLIGSISGLAILLANLIPLSVSTIMMLLNVLLLVVGFLWVGREFGAKTVYTSILLPILFALLEQFFPHQVSIMGDPFTDLLCHVFLSSIGLSILFHRNASSGGLDIIAKLMNKFLKIELGSAMSLSGMIVALSSVFFYPPKIVILSILGTYLCGTVLDRMILGFHIKKRVCILSQKEEEIRTFLLRDLHSGATLYQTVGAYHMEPQRELITIVDKNEYMKLMNFIERVDPDAFITVYEVHKVICRPKV